MEARQFSAAIAAIKQIVILSGIRIERSERGAPGEFEWIENGSAEEPAGVCRGQTRHCGSLVGQTLICGIVMR
jgi:hypothetical protein